MLAQYCSAPASSIDANNVTIHRKRLSLLAKKECPTVGRIVNGLGYRFPKDVVIPNSAEIKDEDDRHIATQMSLKKKGKIKLLKQRFRKICLSYVHCVK